MDTFEFKARKRSGEQITGKITAINENAVVNYIKEQDMFATQIKKVGDGARPFWVTLLEQSITLYDLSIFCRQFATLVGAGVSLIGALEIMSEQTSNKKFKVIIKNVSEAVRKGSPLSGALRDQQEVFPVLMINMIEAGEAGGMLETVLYRLAEQYEKDYRLNAKLKSAMVYPAVVIGVAIVSVGIILTFVMPTFVGLFTSMNIPLPWPTMIVMALSEFMVDYWWVLFIVLGGLIVAYKQAVKNRDFCMWRDRFYLRLPVLGELYNKVIISRFATTFASLSRSGVPILSALTIVSKATGSVVAEDVFKAARLNVQRGKSLSVPMQESKLFPPLVVNMVSIGEETGNLEYMLDRISEFYSAEVEDMTSRLQALLDPFLIVILGLLVGFIAVAMLLPMFDVITKVGNV